MLGERKFLSVERNVNYLISWSGQQREATLNMKAEHVTISICVRGRVDKNTE